MLAGSDLPEIVPASGGGNLLGPGLDGSQGHVAGLAVGRGGGVPARSSASRVRPR
jgi:hypothetical protein